MELERGAGVAEGESRGEGGSVGEERGRGEGER